VLEADEFTVVDAKTNEDLTRSILLQIILEEEAHGVPMFSSVVLSQIIRYYGHAMQGMMGSYLEKNVQAFTDIQNKFTTRPPARSKASPSARNVDPVHEYPGPDDAGHDEQLHRPEQEPVPADAGADAEPEQGLVRRVPVRGAAGDGPQRRNKLARRSREGGNPSFMRSGPHDLGRMPRGATGSSQCREEWHFRPPISLIPHLLYNRGLPKIF
jgi:polyhydroxyalkanoate synthesis repressor PhaR